MDEVIPICSFVQDLFEDKALAAQAAEIG